MSLWTAAYNHHIIHLHPLAQLIPCSQLHLRSTASPVPCQHHRCKLLPTSTCGETSTGQPSCSGPVPKNSMWGACNGWTYGCISTIHSISLIDLLWLFSSDEMYSCAYTYTHRFICMWFYRALSSAVIWIKLWGKIAVILSPVAITTNPQTPQVQIQTITPIATSTEPHTITTQMHTNSGGYDPRSGDYPGHHQPHRRSRC